MVEVVITPKLADEIDALIRLATMVLGQHTNDHGLCAVCGCAFPCSLAVLAEHNLAL
jgi:hypothetical protein